MTTNEAPLTREDVLRLIDSHGGPVGLDLSNRTFEAGINLEGVSLEQSNLQNSRFGVAFTRTTGGVPESVDRGAQLKKANLMRTNLRNASLRYANLEEADLRWTDISEANLLGADLTRARLSNANLRGTNLDYAKIYLVRMHEINIDSNTRMQNMNWGRNYRVGEEDKKDFKSAESVYRTLEWWYAQAGLKDLASEFAFRRQEAKRKAIGAEISQMLKMVFRWLG